MQKVIATIQLSNILRNAEKFKRQSKGLYAVVKADAYGHGAEEVTLALNGVADGFCVALVEEGMAIRAAACGKEILVLTPPVDEDTAYQIAVNGFIASIGDLYGAKLFTQTCQKYGLQGRIHLKVNTGMNRYGASERSLKGLCAFLQTTSQIKVEGIYSHLYGSDEETAREQRELFVKMQTVCKGYFPDVIAHLSATFGATLGEKFSFDRVRVGLGLYGYSPAPTPFPLERAMTVQAQAITSRRYAFGGVGYGEKRKNLAKGKKLTVCRVGYADGFLRTQHNGLEGGENASALCMDARICYGGARRGRWITVLSNAEEIARQTGTISYEVLCAATRRAERIYEL